MMLGLRKFFSVVLFWVLGVVISVTSPKPCDAQEQTFSNQQIRIILNETSLVSSDHIYLGQISDIYAGDFLKESLEDLVIGKSPRPDQIKSFGNDKIRGIIRAQHYLPETIEIVCPDRIYVKRSSQKVTQNEVQTYVSQALDLFFKNRPYEIVSFDVRGLEIYPMGKVTFKIDENEMIGKKGRLSFFIDILIDGKKADRVNIKGKIASYEEVLCAKTDLKKGRFVSRDDFVLESKNIYDLDEGYIADFEVIADKILKSGVKKGNTIVLAHLSIPHMVKKGQIVTLVAKNKNLRIVTSGMSKENGYKDSLVKVENLNSGKLVRGIVKANSKVEVLY